MPETMAKGLILKRLDNTLSNPRTRKEIYSALMMKPRTSLASIARQFGIAANDEEEEHLRNDWFGPKWWKEIDAGKRETVVRASLIRAIELLNEKSSRVVDSYWVCHPGHEDLGAENVHQDVHSAGDGHHGGNGHASDKHFEACVCYSDEQVTVFLHTPDPPNRLIAWGDPIFLVKIDKTGKVKERDLKTGKYSDVEADGSRKKVAPEPGLAPSPRRAPAR
jgi:hypothetical protein